MTPHQLNLVINEYSRQQQESYEEKISLAYIQAFWTYQWFTKQHPEPLEKILGKDNDNSTKEMTDEEMLQRIKELHMTLGGTTY